MHDHATKTYAMLQHDEHSPQKKATLTSNIGALRHGKRSQHQQKPALTKFKGAHLLKWLVAFCLLDCVGAAAEPWAAELVAMEERHAAELQEARQEFYAETTGNYGTAALCAAFNPHITAAADAIGQLLIECAQLAQYVMIQCRFGVSDRIASWGALAFGVLALSGLVLVASKKNKTTSSRQLSLCPFAAKGLKTPNKRTVLKKIMSCPFAAHTKALPPVRTVQVTTTKTFWELYQVIANEQTGLFGDSMDAVLQEAPILRAMVVLAEQESAHQYALCDADGYRQWVTRRLDTLGDPSQELGGLTRPEKKLVLGACVYLRHSWHQGNPNAGPLDTTSALDSQGRVISEPPQLKLVVEYVASELGVAPYFNVHSWLFCNWKWTPTTTEPEDLSYDKICDLTTGSMSPRFFWLTGPAQESEVNFWRAFAYSEFMAVPLYGQVGTLLDQVNAYQASTEGPSAQSIATVLQSLSTCRDIVKNITAALVAYVTPELIVAKDFLQMQDTAHYAGTTAGASGFQAPCMVLLDTLVGMDYSRLSHELQETRRENIDEMCPQVVALIFGVVRPGARGLRDFIGSIVCPLQRKQVQVAFNGVAQELVFWRTSHRNQVVNYVKASTITTGRTNDNMEGGVHGTFMKERRAIIVATKATLFDIEH